MLHKKDDDQSDKKKVKQSDQDPIKVVLCWHMHQPQYQDQLTQQFQRPWTYLHAIKDYIDMATILRGQPRAKAVFNFSPVLLEQLNAYSYNIRSHFDRNEPICDPVLAMLVADVLPSELDYRQQLLQRCLQINEERLIQRFPQYADLAQTAKSALNSKTLLRYLNDDFYTDIVTWYHLAWMGETVRDNCQITQNMTTRGKDFTLEERRWLLAKIGEIISQVIPTYRAMVEKKQIEISITPDKHPIIPLLIDFDSALEAIPDAILPKAQYPGGRERAQVHLQKSVSLFESCFGTKPKGCWPSEGGLSDETLPLLVEQGFEWTATGGGVFQNSIEKAGDKNLRNHHATKVGDSSISCFFRDDNLSDDIGFKFSNWDASDAVNHLLHHAGNIRNTANSKKDCVVSIILDGENCWEYYEKNGFDFLNLLYERFSQHPDFELSTFSDFLETQPKHNTIPALVAGSWVYGTFSTWIGDPDKNRAWEILCEAKAVYDEEILKPDFSAQLKIEAEKQLAICEGSDWFWWFGDYNATKTVAEFDELFRMHVRNLYQVLGVAAPDYLDDPVATRTDGTGLDGPENAGTMRRSTSDESLPSNPLNSTAVG